MKFALSIALKLILAILILITAVALIASDAWWIQVFDFPRLQFAVLLIIAILAIVAIGAKHRWIWAAAGLAALIFQVYQVYPYSAVAATQSADAETCKPGNQIALMNVNVLQTNTQYAKLIDLVEAEKPDVLLVMENNSEWVTALKALDADYPYQELRPLDNKYGMALYSRLPLDNMEVRDLAGEGTPSIKTRVKMPGGKMITLFAVHPRPPHPGQGSGQRDAELILLSRDVKKSGRPAVIMGDFNDVGWSSAMELFQKVGSVLDARIGRQYGATFDATNPLMRWPLDHIFHTDDFGVSRFDTGPDIGSDHFPLIVHLCQNEERFRPRQDIPQADEEAREEAAEQLRMGAGADVQQEAEKLEPDD